MVDADALARAALADDPAGKDENDIVGSWLLTITPGGGSQFEALGTFGVDGTFTGANQGDICCGSNSSADHGAWKRTNNQEFALTFLQLVYDPRTGTLTGMYKVEASIKLGRAGWHGNYTLYVYDAHGNLGGDRYWNGHGGSNSGVTAFTTECGLARQCQTHDRASAPGVPRKTRPTRRTHIDPRAERARRTPPPLGYPAQKQP